jgi:hypothetical protein
VRGKALAAATTRGEREIVVLAVPFLIDQGGISVLPITSAGVMSVTAAAGARPGSLLAGNPGRRRKERRIARQLH